MVICFCQNDSDDNHLLCSKNSTCTTDNYCYSAKQIVYNKKNKIIKKSAGCLYNSETSLFHCKTKSPDIVYSCCKDHDFCNQLDYNSTLKTVFKSSSIKSDNNISLWPSIVIFIILIICLIFSLILLIIYRRRKLITKKRNIKCACTNLQNTKLLINDDSFIDNSKNFKKESIISITDEFDSNSIPLMSIQNSLSNNLPNEINCKLYKELKFQNLLSKSNSINKYYAKRNEIDVFVKIYSKDNQKLWLNEINIYKIILLRHENILNFIAKSDFYDNKLRTKNYLTVTEYHQFGNLECFLKTEPNLTEQQLIRLMLSAASGINHLHLEISNNQRKPSIVHRNLNSKNFIIKQNLTCVLANFNYAIKSTDLDNLDEHNFDDNFDDNCKQHKNRSIKIVNKPIIYCPPEYLDNTINLKSIVSLKSADIYSFGLVLSQILNYFITNQYRLPFSLFNQDKKLSSNLIDYQNIENDELERLKIIILKRKLTILDDLNEIIYKFKFNIDKYDNLITYTFLLNENKNLNNKIDNYKNDNQFLIHKFKSKNTLLELLRIIKESCYLDPLSRLSARRIENDLNKILINL